MRSISYTRVHSFGVYFVGFDKCIEACTLLKLSHRMVSLPPNSSAYSPLPSLQLVVTTDLTVPTVLPFPECGSVGTTQRAAFSDRLLSVSNLH
jgi:hypothetical protein